MVPQMLTDDQKRIVPKISRFLLFHYEDDPGDFIERVVAQDETWVHQINTESKMQSKQWRHPALPLLRNLKDHSAGKVMASIIWDSQWES